MGTSEKPVAMKVAVWFDRPRDCLCVADRLDAPRAYKAKALRDGVIVEIDKQFQPGDPIPDEFVIRVPLLYGEEFVEAVFQMASTGSDFCKIMDGVQRLLDKRAVDAIEISENLRAELEKRSGGGAVGWNQNQLSVKANEHIKLREVAKRAAKIFEKARSSALEDRPGRQIADDLIAGIGDLKDWMIDQRLYEPGKIPFAHPEEAGEGA